MVNFQHGQTEQRFANLPFEVNNFEIPGLATFPGAPQPYGGFNHIPATTCYTTPSSAFSMTPIAPQIQDVYHSSAPEPQSTIPAYILTAGLTRAMGIHESMPFRRSKWEVETYAAWNQGAPQHNVQSSVFKNSHYNPAHYSNPEFEPEQWTPTDYVAPDRTRSPKKSCSGSPDAEGEGPVIKIEDPL